MTILAEGLRVLAAHGGVVEARLLNTSQGTVSGYFDDLTQLEAALRRWDGKVNLYVTANPVRRDLLARANNRLQPWARWATKDEDIVSRIWFLLDVDAVRPAGISATADELAAAVMRRDEIVSFCHALGFVDPVLGMSGNGGHGIWSVDLPNDEATTHLFESALRTLDAQFSDNVACVDASVFNAARIWKVYGSLVVKGDSLPERPHRRAVLEAVPAPLACLPRERLEALAAFAPPVARTVSIPGPLGARYDLVGAFQARGWYKRPLDGGKHAVVCPWANEHSGDSGLTESVLFEPQGPHDPWGFDCKHSHCAHRTIRNVLAVLGMRGADTSPDAAGDPAPEPNRAGPTEPNAGDDGDGPDSAPASSIWPVPKPVTPARPPVEPFDVAALMPESFAPWVQDVAERVQCPPDYVAITVMVAAGSVIGRQVVIHPKRYDDWEVVPNLWGLAIGPPGIMKTPASKEGLRPLRRLTAAEMERYRDAMRDARFIRMKREAREKRLKKLLEEALDEAGGDEQAPDVEAIRAQLREPEEALPKERRYLTNDATVEKVGVLLNENPNGLLVFRDELAGLIATMDREGHQNDRAFYEECWNGSGSYRVDRIERGTLYVEAACLSLLGGIQPARLEAYLREWERRGLDDGFIQRFQLMVSPDVGPFRHVDRWPESRARETAVEAFRLIDRLDLRHLQAKTDGGHLPWLNFDDAAQGLFDAWYTTLQTTLRSDAWPLVLRQHFAKFPSLVLALALIDHLVAGGTGSIPAPCATRALAWVPYLTAHARRVYATLTDRAQAATAALAQRLLDPAAPVPDPFTLRWVYRHHWTGLTARIDVEPAVQRLIELGWLREVVVATTGTGGRPTNAFAINPAVRTPGFGTSGTECPPQAAPADGGSGTFGTALPIGLPENIDGMEWNRESLAMPARLNTTPQNPGTTTVTRCHKCQNPLAACVCTVAEFIDDARE